MPFAAGYGKVRTPKPMPPSTTPSSLPQSHHKTVTEIEEGENQGQLQSMLTFCHKKIQVHMGAKMRTWLEKREKSPHAWLHAELRLESLRHPDPSIKRLPGKALATIIDEETMQRLATVSMALEDSGAPCDYADSGSSGHLDSEGADEPADYDGAF